MLAPLSVTTRARKGRLNIHWVEHGDWTMHVRASWESGPPVVLVHGLTISSRYMVPTGELLAPYCRVLAPDLPGFGLSDRTKNTLTLADLAEALVACLDAFHVPRAAFVGNSLGCQVIAELAVRHPSQVSSVVFVGPTVDPKRRGWIQQAGGLLLDIARERPSMLWEEITDLWYAGVFRTLKTFSFALKDPIEEKLPKIRVPALVVRGSRDPIVSQRWAEEAAGLLPYGRLAIIPDCPHAVNYTCAEELAELILPFLGVDAESGFRG